LAFGRLASGKAGDYYWAPVTTEPELLALRHQIDDLDSQILGLVARRIEAVLSVGAFKRLRGMPVYDAERERAVLQRLMDQAPQGVDPQVVRRVFERIIDECRGIEQHEAVEKS
jgi:chorismate mutase